MNKKTRLVFAVIGLLGAASVWAHHSVAPLFDVSKEITVQGVVTKYNLGNPHMRIYLDVKEGEETVQWLAEGGSRVVLIRKGWDGKEFAPGDSISIVGNPSRNGSPVIHLTTIILPDGRELFGEDLSGDVLKNRTRRKREE